jgi:hypothetical protein
VVVEFFHAAVCASSHEVFPGFPGVKRMFVNQHGFLMRKNGIILTRIRVETV